MDSRLSPESILKSFLANSEYTLWQIRRSMSFRDLGMHVRAEYDFCSRKREIEERMKSLRRYSLINEYLFPKFDECEAVLAEFIKKMADSPLENGWSEFIDIPRSRLYPQARYCTLEFRIPPYLFSGIDGMFFKKVDISVECISHSLFEDVFWENLRPGYDQKQTLDSWTKGKFGVIKGKCLYVAEEPYRASAVLVPAVMAILLSAWTDYLAAGGGKPEWASSGYGTERYRNNINSMMLGSEDELLKSIGEFVTGIPKIKSATGCTPEFQFKDLSEAAFWSDPAETVEMTSEALCGTGIIGSLSRMWEILNKIERLMPDADDKTVVSIWNRCLRRKSTDKDRIMHLLTSKYTGVCLEAAVLLAQNLYFKQASDRKEIRVIF